MTDDTEFKTCSLEGCPNTNFAKTWCHRHYGAWRKTGDPLGLEHLRKVHRRRDAGGPKWQELEDATLDDARILEGLCKVVGCPKSGTAGYNLCSMHYGRFHKYGRVGPVDTFGVKKDQDGYRINKTGYRLKTENGKNIYQHREVYEAYLGRKLESFENIHHINGVRDDNRIENLEMWVTTQPAGQRVQDLVKWAKEILQRYDSEDGSRR